jgi:hypothetical protein
VLAINGISLSNSIRPDIDKTIEELCDIHQAISFVTPRMREYPMGLETFIPEHRGDLISNALSLPLDLIRQPSHFPSPSSRLRKREPNMMSLKASARL